MKYTEYKRRHLRAGIYIVSTVDKDKIYAISDSIEYCNQYIKQFKETWFTPNKIKVEMIPIYDSAEACKIYTTFGDSLMLEEFKPGIVLTVVERLYYTELLSKVYADMKTMMCQLLLNDRLLNLSSDEKLGNRAIFDMYYEKCNSLNNFIECIDPLMFIQEYLLTPIAVMEHMEFDDMYKNAIMKYDKLK